MLEFGSIWVGLVQFGLVWLGLVILVIRSEFATHCLIRNPRGEVDEWYSFMGHTTTLGLHKHVVKT